MGAQLAKLLLPKLPADCELLAVGTNVLATSAMLKAGAVRGATGENAVVYNAARADVILGPIGILMANGIMGEVSPKMSVAISGSEAAKVLIYIAFLTIRSLSAVSSSIQLQRACTTAL